jgi:hypothetical protein
VVVVVQVQEDPVELPTCGIAARAAHALGHHLRLVASDTLGTLLVKLVQQEEEMVLPHLLQRAQWLTLQLGAKALSPHRMRSAELPSNVDANTKSASMSYGHSQLTSGKCGQKQRRRRQQQQQPRQRHPLCSHSLSLSLNLHQPPSLLLHHLRHRHHRSLLLVLLLQLDHHPLTL